MPSNRYLLTLTATGGGTCGLLGPTVQIVAAARDGFANPVSVSTPGACALYDATVFYTVTWTGIPGTSGQLPIACVWRSAVKTCTLTAVSVAAP